MVKNWIDSGCSVKSIAEEFGVHVATVYRWLSGKIPVPKKILDTIKSRMDMPSKIGNVDWSGTWILAVNWHVFLVGIVDLSVDGKILTLNKKGKCQMPNELLRIMLRDWMIESDFQAWFVAEMFQVGSPAVSMWLSGKRPVPKRVVEFIKQYK